MRGISRPQSAEAIIGALADLQHGAVARWQLLARGISAQQIERRIASGRLRPTRRGDSDRPGLIVRKAALEPCEVASIERIPLTTAARTILDCAAILPADEDDRLEQMCAEAHARGLAKAPDLCAQIERNPGKRGVARLARLLDRHGRPARTKRELERRLVALVRASDLPEPEVNAIVEGKERDLVWGDQRVVVEADSYAFHSHALAPGPRTSARPTSSSSWAT